ncbi:MAG: carboxypeptidase-like regulatory domain-containing protein [Bacteroidia bacterium]
MKTARLLILLSAICLLSKCKKENLDMDVNGKVIDGTTNAPMAGVSVELAKDRKAVSHFTTDANGNYSFHISKTDRQKYTVKAEQQTNLYWYSDNLPVPAESESNIDILVYPVRKLVVTVKMVDTTYSDMEVVFPTFSSHMGTPRVTLQRPANIQVMINFNVKGGTTVGFETQVLKGNSYSAVTLGPPAYSGNFSYSVPCSATDTTFYTIQY